MRVSFSFLAGVHKNKDKYYKVQAPTDEKAQMKLIDAKFNEAKTKMKAKAVWKAIGESLGDVGMAQPYGGFGNDIAKLSTASSAVSALTRPYQALLTEMIWTTPSLPLQMISVGAIYKRLSDLKKGSLIKRSPRVIIASEVSGA